MIDVLQHEFERRRARNPRYSLRAFALFLGTDHATLSQILRGRRTLTPNMIRRFGVRLNVDVVAVCEEATHLAVLRALRSASFKPDSRWIATITGISIDRVNISLQRVLCTRRIEMTSRASWRTS